MHGASEAVMSTPAPVELPTIDLPFLRRYQDNLTIAVRAGWNGANSDSERLRICALDGISLYQLETDVLSLRASYAEVGLEFNALVTACGAPALIM